MVSISGQIKKLSLNDKNSVFQLISTKLIEGFYQGKFYQEKELADMCFTGSSTVTKYAKSIGLSGYRELIIRLHYEYEKLNITKRNIASGDKGLCVITNTAEWLNTNQDFLLKLKICISQYKEINIFCSYQSYDAVLFFKRILEELGTRVIIITGQDFMSFQAFINKSKLNLFILCGPDTNQLMDTITRFFESENKENYLVSTQGQYEKLPFKPKEILLIDIPDAEATRSTRTMILINLFYKIYFMTKSTK